MQQVLKYNTNTSTNDDVTCLLSMSIVTDCCEHFLQLSVCYIAVAVNVDLTEGLHQIISRRTRNVTADSTKLVVSHCCYKKTIIIMQSFFEFKNIH